MPLQRLEYVPTEVWDQLVKDSTNANIFHERQYIDCFRKSHKYVPFSVFFEKSGRVSAAIIGLQTRMLGSHLTNLLSRCVVYGGILLSNEMTERQIERDLGEMIAQYDSLMRKRTLFTEIRNMTDATRLILPLARHDYRFDPHLNYLIDLKGGEEEVWRNLSNITRRKVRRAGEKLSVVEVNNERDLETFYALVQKTYSRVHVPFFESEVFRCVFEKLHPLGWIRVTLAIENGQPVAARAALTYRGSVFDWFAGSTAQGDDCDAGTFLVWNMVEWGCKNGFDVFDFGGAGNPRVKYGVRDFKSRFHGVPVNFGRFIRVYSRPRYLVSSTGYSAVRRVFF